MKKCYFSRLYAIARVINIVGALLSGGTLLFLGILLWNEEPGQNIWCSVSIISGVAIIIYGVLFVIFLSRKYELNEDGLTIQYANRFNLFYSWDRFYQVCICVTHRSGTGATQDEVIWCSTKKIKHAPPDLAHRRSSLEYDFFHHNSILTIEYSPDRIESFRKFYKKDIQDYR